jgi:hypothetical protein
VGPERLVESFDLAPGMRVLDAGCGPRRLTIPLAKAVGPDRSRYGARRGARPRRRAARALGLYAALRPGGGVPVTEIFGDPDCRRPAAARGEVEAAGFRLVRRFGGFPAYTLKFERPRALTAEQPSPESLAL